jgi:peptidoglycan hydrolase CwlO-like protein
MIQEGMCEVIGPIVEEKAADRWREQLKRAKDRAISELEAELRSVKQKLQAIEAQLAQAQSDVMNAEKEIDLYQRAQGSVVADFEPSCGNRQDLFQTIP